MEVQYACFNEFPDQCNGCPQYTESHQDQETQLTLLAGLGTFVLPQYMVKTVKECRRYHKRNVEYLK